MRTVRFIVTIAVLSSLLGAAAQAADVNPLEIEAKISLGEVRGRIDHLAIDIARRRLYVAELGNDSIAVVDLKTQTLLTTLVGLHVPQGIAYVPSTDSIYVADSGTGSVQIINAETLGITGRIAIGEDTDNVRVDTDANLVYVGYGNGALAVIDPVTRVRVRDIPLKSHPESFQLERQGTRIFVNVPEAGEVAVIERLSHKQIKSWSLREFRGNFPLALDEEKHQVLVAFRNPARLAAVDTSDGALLSSSASCGDADDVFVDQKRRLISVICGEGAIDTFEQREGGLVRIGRLATRSGARTGLYVAEVDRVFLAVRKTNSNSAEIWILRASSPE